MKLMFAIVLMVLAFITCRKKQAEPVIMTNAFVKDVPLCQTQVKEIPILCYHNFTEDKNTNITLSRSRFEEQVKSLADSGYHSILPDDLYEHLTTGKTPPTKPIMFSFDDTRKAQYTIAEPILRKYRFTDVFFIMTVCINKPGYMSSVDLKDLSRKGYCVEAHTYDHPMIGQIKCSEWNKQLQKPKLFLEQIIGRPVNYFAYPYGTWTDVAIVKLKQYWYKGAFQLSERQSTREPLFTIRRLMVQGVWTAKALHKHIAEMFSGTFDLPKPKYVVLFSKLPRLDLHPLS